MDVVKLVSNMLLSNQFENINQKFRFKTLVSEHKQNFSLFSDFFRIIINFEPTLSNFETPQANDLKSTGLTAKYRGMLCKDFWPGLLV